jgi:hypothetical protein
VRQQRALVLSRDSTTSNEVHNIDDDPVIVDTTTSTSSVAFESHPQEDSAYNSFLVNTNSNVDHLLSTAKDMGFNVTEKGITHYKTLCY